MSGRRHHIIPQFLLRNFATRSETGEFFMWVYRKRAKPFRANTTKTSVETDFYGHSAGEAESADPAITAQETLFADLTQELTTLPQSSTLDHIRIGQFAAHLSARTKNLRLAYTESVQFLISELHSYLTYPHNLELLVLGQLKKTGVIKQHLDTILPPDKCPQVLREYVSQQMENLPPQVTISLCKQMAPLLAPHFEQALAALPSLAASGHIKAMNCPVTEAPRAEFLSSLSWRLEDTDTPLILGDPICLFKSATDSTIRPYSKDTACIEVVIIPLSPRRLLCGTVKGKPYEPAAETVNLASVRCSREYYISSLSPEEHGPLQPQIGLDATFFSEAEIKEIARQMFESCVFPNSGV